MQFAIAAVIVGAAYVVIGKIESEVYAWNKVMLDGQCNVDACWDDGSTIIFIYFLKSDSSFENNRHSSQTGILCPSSPVRMTMDHNGRNLWGAFRQYNVRITPKARGLYWD